MPIPYHGATSLQSRPSLGTAVLDMQDLEIQTESLIYVQPHITYVVSDTDTIAEVARRLYGANTVHARNALRAQGFEPGAVLHIPCSYLEGQD